MLIFADITSLSAVVDHIDANWFFVALNPTHALCTGVVFLVVSLFCGN